MCHKVASVARHISLYVYLSLTLTHAQILSEISATSGAAVLPIHGLQACGNVGKSGSLVGQRLPAVADERCQRWRCVTRDVRPQAPMHDRQRRLNPADTCVRHLRTHARIVSSACQDPSLPLPRRDMQELVYGMGVGVPANAAVALTAQILTWKMSPSESHMRSISASKVRCQPCARIKTKGEGRGLSQTWRAVHSQSTMAKEYTSAFLE